MNIEDFHFALTSSGITPSEVMKFLFDKNHVNKKLYPDAFDPDGHHLLNLKAATKGYHTYCPFHSGQTKGDSFFIDNRKQKTICFNGGCSASNKYMNIIDLVICLKFDQSPSIAADKNLSGQYFFKAAKFLVENFGDKLGLSVEDISSKGEYKRNKKQDILQASADYYNYLGTQVPSYKSRMENFFLETRHFKYSEVDLKDIVTKYKLGITPNSKESNKLYAYLAKKGFADDDILDSGVCKQTADGIKDFFRNHIIVPYIYKGKIIGMYGRHLNPSSDSFRHLRLSGVVEVPNGLDDIYTQEEFMLVEGEISKLAVVMMGVSNVLESRGTNGLKEEHALLIEKIRNTDSSRCKKCYIVFDPDEAGRKSIMKTGKKLQDIGVEVVIVRMPVIVKDGEKKYLDPNDLIKEYGEKAAEVFKELCSEAISLDAYSLLFTLEEENITTLSEARISLKRTAEYLEYVPMIERIFIVEEVVDLLYPSFESKGLSKDLLRQYISDAWLSKEALNNGVEGFSSENRNSLLYYCVKDEEKYKNLKAKNTNMLLVKDLEHLKKKASGKKLIFDNDFNKDEVCSLKSIASKVYIASLETAKDEEKQIQLSELKKIC